MKVEIKFEANLEETQDLEMVRKICQVIGANPVTVKTTDVKKSVPAQDVKKPAPAPEKTEESEPMPMDANSSLGSDNNESAMFLWRKYCSASWFTRSLRVPISFDMMRSFLRHS